MSDGVRFGAFEFDSERHELRKRGLRIKAPDQSLEILSALVERPGETVTRERIRSILWPHGTSVGFEQSINAAVKRLREALRDPAGKSCYFERVPRQGYRFIAPVEPVFRHGHAAPLVSAGAILLHYRLMEPAGSGSMGEIWKAEDLSLGRIVALKFLPRRLASDPVALEGIRREARHAASLNHPNICTIHDLEEHDGQRFLVMEYIDGKPLSEVMEGGPLDPDRIVKIGIGAARALSAAHRGGILHRDVKPANLVLTSDGRVKLSDFGIARAALGLEPPSAGAGSRTPAGTLGYISPEQARGDPVDSRSDLFSLGVVLYEMATGRRPFRGETPTAALQALLNTPPVRPRALNPELAEELEGVILKSLEKHPASRWQSAVEMIEALEAISSAITLTGRNPVVIASFENHTGDADFNNTPRQILLLQVGQSRYLSVVSEDRIHATLVSMNRPADQHLNPEIASEICQRTGAKAFLSGSIGILGGRYFVGLQASSNIGEMLASEYAEADCREQVLAAVSSAVLKIDARLEESLSSIRSTALAEATTPSLEALKIYSVALRERAAGNDAAPLLERAIRIDPDFASAHHTLAQMHFVRGRTLEAEDAISRAFAHREHTKEPEKLAIEGFYHKIASGDARQGIAVGLLARELYPNDSTVWRAAVMAHCRAGEYDRALALAHREVEVAPKDGVSYFDLAIMLILFKRNRDAADLLKQALDRGVNSELFPFARYVIAAMESDFAAMQREVQSARGKPWEDRISVLAAQTAGYFGQLARARAIAHRAVGSTPAVAASVALNEAVFGLDPEATARARSAMPLDSSRRTAATCALTFALTGEPDISERILSDLTRRYPHDTVLNEVWLPSVRGAVALRSGDLRRAIELSDTPTHTAASAWPSYVRGTACLRLGLASQAASEFRKIMEKRPSLFVTAFNYGAAFAYPAAQLGLARALAMCGELDESRQAYDAFLASWSQADSNIPILVQAKSEYGVQFPKGSFS